MDKNFLEKDKQIFLPTYNRIPIEISHGSGVYLFDKQGNKYLDLFAGLAVNALGYAHPKIVSAVSEQISKFAHLSNNFVTNIQIEFAYLLLKHSKMSKVFLTNSGTEAVEGALKLIRLKEGPDKKIFSMTNSFHGRTYGAMSLTAREKYRKGFEPLVPNIDQIIFNDVEDLRKKINSNTAAVILEFIQGEGGINVVSPQFVSELFELKKKFNFSVIADAIQDGIGRTGKPFAHEFYGVEPDIVIVAKAIGGGLPLGGFMTSEKFDKVFEPGKHGTTFGGNPVSCAAGKVVLEEIFENGLLNEVAKNGEYFISQLKELSKSFPDDIKEVRGRGYIIGVELYYAGNEIVNKLRERGILINCTNQNVLRLLPPLITGKNEVNFFLSNLNEVLKKK